MAKLILFIALLIITSCNQKSEKNTMDTISIKIGESGESFLKRNAMNGKAKVDRQPAGLTFYEHGWKTNAPGKVRLEHGPYSFEIPFVLGVTGTEDTELMQEGITSYDIQAGVTFDDKVLHDEARKATIQLLDHLQSLGWKRYIAFSKPRLKGKEAFDYYHEKDDVYGLPLDYQLSLDEWMAIDVGRWYLYTDDVFLEITFRRDRKLMNPNEQGAYLFIFEITSSINKGKSQFRGDDKNRWQDLWVEKIKARKKERYQIEDRLRKQGFTIDEKYEEPKIHPADPVEP